MVWYFSKVDSTTQRIDVLAIVRKRLEKNDLSVPLRKLFE